MQVLIQLDEETAAQLEKVAPARSRKRSEFIRQAIRKALLEHQETRTREAYRQAPDDEPAYFDSTVWEVHDSASRARRKKRQ